MTLKSRVSPFGNLRIKVCSQLPEAYRNVLRPSSPLNAKASTKRPFHTLLLNSQTFFIHNIKKKIEIICNKIQMSLDIIKYYLLFKKSVKSVDWSSWWRRTGSNRRPIACKATALPTELRPQTSMVGQGGLEPPTPRLSSVCSNQLSY